LIPVGRGTALCLLHRDDRKGRPCHSEQFLWFYLEWEIVEISKKKCKFSDFKLTQQLQWFDALLNSWDGFENNPG
jgi:hypothetical protein